MRARLAEASTLRSGQIPDTFKTPRCSSYSLVFPPQVVVTAPQGIHRTSPRSVPRVGGVSGQMLLK